MDTMTSTATKVVSNTKLAIATIALFAAGGVALAAAPIKTSDAGYGWYGCLDSDNTLNGSTNPYDPAQLSVKGYTKYNSGSKTDYCHTFPKTGKTYLMEGICKEGKFLTWQKNCAELNLGKPGANYQCVDGACVNKTVSDCYTVSVKGQRIKSEDNPNIWYLDGGVKHSFISADIYFSWFTSYAGVQSVSPSVFNSYQEGSPVCLNKLTGCYLLESNGMRIKSASDPIIWYLSNNYIHLFPSYAVYKTWFVDYSGVQSVSDLEFSNYLKGNDVCANPNPIN